MIYPKRHLQFAFTLVALLIAFVLVSPVFGEKANYFYDSLGRLTRIVSEAGDGAIFIYDEVGNLLSTSQDKTKPLPPVLTSINPEDILSGTTVTITIHGENLLSAESVSALDAGITINGFSVINDRMISASVTLLQSVPTGLTGIEVTNLYGSSVIEPYVHEAIATPVTVYLGEGDSATITAELSNPVTWDVIAPIFNQRPDIVSIPSYITIPAGGSAAVSVTALGVGSDILNIGGAAVNLFVTPAYAGDASISSGGVSVRMTAIPSGSLINSHPVNVRIESIRGGGYTSGPVSVQMTSIPGSMAASRAVSVQMTSAPGGTVVSRPVSVTINN